jgi:hypothetical protein
MAGTTTNGNGKTRRADRDGVTDQHVIARILEMHSQGYSIRDIVAALAKQGLITLSPECVAAILDAHRARKH